MEFQIKFRPFRLTDAKFVNDLRQIESMEKMIGGPTRPVSYERDTKWVDDLIMKDDPSNVYFVVTELDSDEIIGYTSVGSINFRHGTCEWGGIKLHPSVAGKGYGTQVGLKLVKFCFEELRMNRFGGECQEEHLPGLNLMLKCGFQKEGLMRKKLFKNGKANSQWLLSVTDDDYIAIKEKYNL